MNLAVIPARGGSKRIPRKNIKDFCGKPIIAWSIQAAIEAKCFDRIIVSTDDDEIAQIARSYGAEVPFKRPAHISDDYAITAAVVKHAIEWLHQEESIELDWVCCIYPTAPFITTQDLNDSLSTIIEKNCDFVFPVTEYSFPIQRAVKLCDDKHIKMFQPEYFEARSQDLEKAYHDAGQFYWGASTAWKAELPVFSANSYAHPIPCYRVQDIDTPSDWVRASLMFSSLHLDPVESN